MLVRSDGMQIRKYFFDRFGVPPDVFNGYTFFESSRSVWFCSATFNPTLLEMKKIEYPGIRLLRKINQYTYKPTTYALQLIGQRATKNIIRLKREQVMELLRRGELQVSTGTLQDGYVIVAYREDIIGCALYRQGLLKAQLPRGRAEAMALSGLIG